MQESPLCYTNNSNPSPSPRYFFTPINENEREEVSTFQTAVQYYDQSRSASALPSETPMTFAKPGYTSPLAIPDVTQSPLSGAYLNPTFSSINHGNGNRSNGFHPSLQQMCSPCNMGKGIEKTLLTSLPQANQRFVSTVPRMLEAGSPPHYTRRMRSDSESNSSRGTTRSSASSRSSSTYSSTSLEQSQHMPQNMKGDLLRQAKVKTELCLYFLRGTKCPFGPRCNYAHGESELKYTTLVDLQKAGLIEDVNTYRAHPCFSWVATGACPFGLRCSNIHDARVASVNSSWLPHSDVPVSNLKTNLNVDKAHHWNLAALSQSNPLISKLIWGHRPSLKKMGRATGTSPNHSDMERDSMEESAAVEWRDTYSLVCNLANMNVAAPFKGAKESTVPSLKVSELQRLCVAIHMGYCKKRIDDYVYKPEHLVYNELCMVLQTKYFRLLKPKNVTRSLDITSDTPITSFVCEISEEEYKGSKVFWDKRYPFTPNEVISVHELVFGCMGETIARASLWIELVGHTALNPQEVKRFKRGRQRNKIGNSGEAKKFLPFPGSDKSSSKTGSSFYLHPHKPFFRIQPVCIDSAVFDLVKNMFQHRLAVLIQREYRAFNGTENEIRNYITNQDSVLRNSFNTIKHGVENWSWPVTKGMANVSAGTSVPKCSSEYNPSPTSKSVTVIPIWESFLDSDFNTNQNKSCRGKDGKKTSSRFSLGVFQQLSQSRSLNTHRTLPHILKQSSSGAKTNDVWKSILLESDVHDEWKIIKEHYLEANQFNHDKCMPLNATNTDRITSLSS